MRRFAGFRIYDVSLLFANSYASSYACHAEPEGKNPGVGQRLETVFLPVETRSLLPQISI